MEIVFATNNKYKFEEVKNQLPNGITLLSLQDINFNNEIPETGENLKDNASQKSFFIYNKFKLNCFADDTGLEVDALDGKPGVYSARYAGENPTFKENINKLLSDIGDNSNRSACFRTVISLIIDGYETQFEGKIMGTILSKITGNKGFGYDPIFKPNDYEISFAEMELYQKNKISHRALAIKKLIKYLYEIT